MEKKYNIAFWLKKMYLLQQIPYSDKLIKKGLDDVDVWLCSTGGAGSNFLKDRIDPFVKVKSPYMAALLTNHKEPVAYQRKGFKAIYLHTDPFDALKSMKRRGLVETNIKKLNNSKNLETKDEVLLRSFFHQFNNWTQNEITYPVLCIRYESLFESVDILEDYLGFSFKEFPPKQERSSFEIDIDQKLYNQFAKEYEIWKAFPDSLIRNP